MLDVVEIELHHFVERNAAPPAHLPKPGEPRPHLEPELVPFLVVLELVLQGRPRPHDGHLSLEDVDELRKFIEARFPQEVSDRGDARIVCQLINGRCFFVKA